MLFLNHMFAFQFVRIYSAAVTVPLVITVYLSLNYLL
jgi:hypothetical protein